MKSKSVVGFVMGLLSGVILGIESFYVFFVLVLADALTQASGKSSIIFNILCLACAIGPVLAIVGASFCFKKSKIGGVIMFIAFLMLSMVPIYAIVNSTELQKTLILWIIPLIALLIGAICALSVKKKQKNTINTAVDLF